MKKPQKKTKRSRCQGTVELERCKNFALIETTTNLTNGEFSFPVKVKLCMPCDGRFSLMFPRLSEIKRES